MSGKDGRSGGSWRKESLYAISGNQISAVTMEISKEVPQKTKNKNYHTTIPLLGINKKKPKSPYNRDTCTTIFIMVLFITAKLWNQPT
jgi:hypothetical protein